MLYGKETLILEEAMSTLLSNEIRKRLNQDEQMIRFDGYGKKKKKRRKENSRLVKDVSLLSQEKSLKGRMQASARVVEEEEIS